MTDAIVPFPFTDVTLGSEPSVSIEVITPTMANDIIQNRNPLNRKINKINARRLAADMRNGEWKFNGDTISFTSDGMLFDGQHRLQAVVDSSLQQKFIVVYNIDFDDAAGTKDAGKNRSPADYLMISHEVRKDFAAAIASACSKLAAWERTQGHAVVVGAANKLSTRAIGDFYARNKEAIDYAAEWAGEIKNKDLLVRRDELLFLATLILNVDADQGEIFLNQVFKGVALEQDTMTHLLNEMLTDWRNYEIRNKQKNYTVGERLLTVLRTWDYFRRGKNIRTRDTVKWREGKDYPKLPFGSYTL